MLTNELGNNNLHYESPKMRVLALKAKGAILYNSVKNADIDGFDTDWNDNFWGE